MASAILMLLVLNGFKLYMEKTYDAEWVEMVRDEPSKRLQDIYNNIAKNTGRWDELPPLYMIGNPWSVWTINAFAGNHGIYFTYGMMLAAKNDDEIAMLMAHEMAHELLGHVSHPYLPESALAEAQADQLGAFLMMRSGYDICKGRMFWVRMRDMSGDDIVGSHPNASTRIYQLNMPWCDKVPE